MDNQRWQIPLRCCRFEGQSCWKTMATAIPGEAYQCAKRKKHIQKQMSKSTKQYPRYSIGTLTISNSESYFRHIFCKTVFAMKPAEKTPETLSRTEERAKAMSSKERSKAPTWKGEQTSNLTFKGLANCWLINIRITYISIYVILCTIIYIYIIYTRSRCIYTWCVDVHVMSMQRAVNLLGIPGC